jgi:hypothetical protein
MTWALLRWRVDEDALFGAKHVEVEEFIKIEGRSVRAVEFQGNVIAGSHGIDLSI